MLELISRRLRPEEAVAGRVVAAVVAGFPLGAIDGPGPGPGLRGRAKPACCVCG